MKLLATSNELGIERRQRPLRDVLLFPAIYFALARIGLAAAGKARAFITMGHMLTGWIGLPIRLRSREFIHAPDTPIVAIGPSLLSLEAICRGDTPWKIP